MKCEGTGVWGNTWFLHVQCTKEPAETIITGLCIMMRGYGWQFIKYGLNGILFSKTVKDALQQRNWSLLFSGMWDCAVWNMWTNFRGSPASIFRLVPWEWRQIFLWNIDMYLPHYSAPNSKWHQSSQSLPLECRAYREKLTHIFINYM